MAGNRKQPFGYRMEFGEYTPHPAEAETVRWIYQTYLAGASYQELVEALQERGIAYDEGKLWNKNMVARILEEMGLEVCGTHGTTAALALLNDAVKKGGVMASSHVGGLSGAFIPVSEDEGMIAAAASGALHLDKLEAMTCVCSVGLDMIAVPGDTTAETLSAIIADEAAIGMVNSKTTAVRLIPAPGKTVGDTVEFGGLLGSAPVMPVHPFGSAPFVSRGGRIPAPMQSLKN